MAVAVLSFAWFAGEADAQQPSTTEVERIDSLFERWSDPSAPGAAVAVVRDGAVVFSRGYGSAQLEYEVPITETTAFHVASVSKQFTTFAIALLARDGLLAWDDEVRTHLPEMPDLGHPVTLRQLASHTSGVRDQWELLMQAGWRIDDVITRDQIMRLMTRQRELNFEPGSEYLYSNMGYSLLAEVVERVSGTDFADFLRERVFLPLGMERTHVHNDHTRVVPGRAYSYAPLSGGGWRNAPLNYANQGATSLFTTAEDLARWIGEMEDPVVGDREIWAEMLDPAVLRSGETVPYGLGVAVSSYRGLAAHGHGGADAGFRAHLLHHPEARFGVVVLGNASSFDSAALARRISDIFLEDRMEPVEAEALAPAPRAQVDEAVLDRLTGRYRAGEADYVRIVREASVLRAQTADGEMGTLLPESDSTFWVTELDGRATFHRDREGRIETLVIRHPGGVERARRIQAEDPTPAELAAFAGTFYSPELDVVYRLRVEDGALTVERPRQPEVTLFPLDADRFGSPVWGLQTLEFTRGARRGIDGFRLSGGRVRNVLFQRVEWEM